MLQEIINLQQAAVSKLVAQLKTAKKEITFKAPTGSGKTYMMADFMNRVLAEFPSFVFLVSSLSKGDLARQNYEKFAEYKEKGRFSQLNPYLINSDIAGEERLHIPLGYNVYLLPRDLYKKGGRLMQGCMEAFLLELQFQAKTIILIKDECHIKTNNLDDLVDAYFYKIFNFSATPKLSRGQTPDVEIKNEDAENCKLIKTVEWGAETDTINDAIIKFEQIKEDYCNLLGVNPCLIIQISNKDKADEEMQNVIMPTLNSRPHLKYMVIVDDDKKCDTNDVFKVKKLPVAKWKDYAKTNTAVIDVIVFKMVITEGWDIPRACMLYQVRDTKSIQLDEQVMGRVRRNPRLLDFETLNEKAQQLAMTAWVWGISPKSEKILAVRLHDESQEITDNIKVKTTKLKTLTKKAGFDINTFIASQPPKTTHKSIFELARQLRQTQNEVREIVYGYATDYEKWWLAVECLTDIEAESNKFICDYSQSMEIAKNENNYDKEVSFAVTSHYTDNGNYVRIGNWVWKHNIDVENFSFDSQAEQDWASILKDLSVTTNTESKRATMPVVMVGKTSKTSKNKQVGQADFFDDVEIDKALTEKEVFLWGKNYVPNSVIKFEYYLGAIHSSYPDFIMKDSYGRIHIFEVKSVNESANYTFDNNLYKAKIEELKKCYKQASLVTSQILYLPIMDGNIWKITQYLDGVEKTLTKSQFEVFVRTN